MADEPKQQDGSNNLTDADLQAQLDALVSQAQKVNQDIDESGKKTSEEVARIEVDANGAIAEIDASLAVLEKADKEAEDELDKLILNHADALTKEE